MEVLLDKTVKDRARVVIVDITGVPVVDSLVANHLAQMLAAIQLIGARGVLTGISANIAQTLVKLGVEVKNIVTRRTVAEGLVWALEQINRSGAKARVS